MYVSVIIPTKNRSRLLQRTLLSLTQQICSHDYEIIVVDNGSTDGTKNVVDKISSYCNYPIRYIYDERPGLLVGRHVGAQNAKGDILSFIDDDVIIPPYWLENVYSVFANPEISLATGNNYPYFEDVIPDWLPYLWRECEYGKYMIELSLMDFGNEQKQIQSGYVWGLNFHIKKDVLKDIGGFHPDVLSEEYKFYLGDGETGISKELADKGYKAFFDPRLSLYHTVTKERMTINYLKKRHYIQGMMDSYSYIRNGITFKEIVPLYKRCINKALRTAAIIKDYIFRKNKKEERKILLMLKELEMKKREGFEAHTKEVENNSLLREYILEKDYYSDLDYIYNKYFK